MDQNGKLLRKMMDRIGLYVFGGFLEDFWRIFGGCLEDVWRIFGGFLEDFWRI